MRSIILAAIIVLAVQVHGLAAEHVAEIVKGDKVLPKLHAVVKDGEENIADQILVMPWIVQDVDGELLQVGQERKGWVQRDNIVTLDEAGAYYTQFVDSDRDDVKAWAYTHRAVAEQELGDITSAIADLGELLRLAPDAVTFNNRGRIWTYLGEYDKAIADFGEAIRLAPTLAASYLNRGNVWGGGKQDYDQAIADFTESIRLDPACAALAYSNRANAWCGKKQYDKAIEDFDQSLRLDPNCAATFCNAASLRASCPDATHRDGKKAVELATKACELTAWTNSYCCESLAAAYAESGAFELAIQYQTKVIELIPNDPEVVKDPAILDEAKKTLKLYQDHQPFREP